MEFLNEYAISIITVSVLGILLESILPEGSNKKYISVLIGLLIMLVILNPLTKLPHYGETFSIPHLTLTDADLTLPKSKSYIADTFEKKLSLSITETIRSAFGKTVNCRVRCEVNEGGQITRIAQIHVDPYDHEIGAKIAATYGFEEDIIGP